MPERAGMNPNQVASLALWNALDQSTKDRLFEKAKANLLEPPVPDDPATWELLRADYEARGFRGIYGYVCRACDHPASIHVMAPDGDLRAGPYCCLECDCEQPQDGPWVALRKREFERWEADHGR